MAHLHNETVDGKNIVFYTDNAGNIWIRAFTLFKAAGIKAPGPALRSYVIAHPGTGQKFTYPGDATGDVSVKYSSPAWHFTYAEAIKFLNATRATGRTKTRETVEATVRALAIRFKVNKVQTGPKPAKAAKAKPAKPAPVKTESPYTATIDRLTAILTDTTQPPYIQLKALNARTFLLELERETCND